jgi:dTDP-4-dehydrorhamnose reductase
VSGLALLVVGASGYVGDALRRHSSSVGRWAAQGLSRRSGLDVTDRDAVFAAVAAVRPAAVVNVAAALGNSGGAAGDSWPVNVRGAGNVAAACAALGVRLVHVSSDVVHAGRTGPYTEADDPSPVFPYGAAKAAAEAAVSAAHPAAAIVRTSLVVSGGAVAGWAAPPSRHEVQALALARGEASGVLFTDEVRCPVPVDGLAAALHELAGCDVAGVVNVAGAEAMSRHELGVRVAERHGLDPSTVPAGRLADTGLVRPGVIRLDCSLIQRLLPDVPPLTLTW